MIQAQNPKQAVGDLEVWNSLDTTAAAAAILPCNGSPAWAAAMARFRPFASPKALFDASDRVWLAMPESDWQKAFDSHPRIGERTAKSATAEALQWSAAEQSAATPSTVTQAALTAANHEYEARFGRIFIVCATGKSAAEILAVLRQRLANDSRSELLEAADQQRQITQLRLRKWLGLT